MCECVVDIIMWKFAFLVHLLIGIIAVVFCTLFLLPRFSDFFLLFWLCQSDLRIYNVKISSENTITTTVISIHCWKLHHWHCEISNQDLFVSVFLSSLSLSTSLFSMLCLSKCEFSRSVGSAMHSWESVHLCNQLWTHRARRILRNGMCQCEYI